MGVQQGGFQEPSCSSVAGAESFIHPTETFGSTKPICSQSPNGPSRADMNTQQQPQEPPVENFLTSLPHSCLFITHTLFSPFGYFCILDRSSDLIVLGQPLAFWRDFHTSWLSLPLLPQNRKIPQSTLPPKDPTTNPLVGATKSTIRELLFWSNGEGCWEGKEKGGARKSYVGSYIFNFF